MKTVEERFWAKVRKTETCWFWTGALSRGYGNFSLHKKDGIAEFIPAHRLSFIWAYGPIPPGRELDHLCRNRACVRPNHLEAVPHRINSQRGAKGRMVTHCRNGHAYTAANTYWRPEGRRNCRQCKRAAIRRYYYSPKGRAWYRNHRD